jgi:hypothetical protein
VRAALDAAFTVANAKGSWDAFQAGDWASGAINGVFTALGLGFLGMNAKEALRIAAVNHWKARMENERARGEQKSITGEVLPPPVITEVGPREMGGPGKSEGLAKGTELLPTVSETPTPEVKTGLPSAIEPPARGTLAAPTPENPLPGIEAPSPVTKELSAPEQEKIYYRSSSFNSKYGMNDRGNGIFFGSDLGLVNTFGSREKPTIIYAVKLEYKNPYYMTWTEIEDFANQPKGRKLSDFIDGLKKEGYDAIVEKNDSLPEDLQQEPWQVAVFSKSQIRPISQTKNIKGGGLTSPDQIQKELTPPERESIDIAPLRQKQFALYEGESKYPVMGEGASNVGHGPSPGSDITRPFPTYAAATEAKPKGQVTTDVNLYVRQTIAPDNSARTLMVQISSDLLQTGPRSIADDIYDKLYQNRTGYARPDDFWEIPQWQAHLANTMPSTDHYTVRSIPEAIEFLNQAGYKNVAFSALDANSSVIHEIAEGYRGNIVVGGYIDMVQFNDLPNVKVFPTIKDFVESEGVEYKPGYDYRHFRGTRTMPRLTMSDGCRHACVFCSVPRGVTETSREGILQQVNSFSDNLSADLIYLNDKTFGQAKNHTMLPEIYNMVKAKNPNFEGFVIQTTAAQMKTLSPEFIQKSGIKYIELGIESYNDPILKAHKKPANEKIIDEAAIKIRQSGAVLIPNIMVGLPGETRESYNHTLKWLDRNKDIISHLNINPVAVYVGTELSNRVKAEGVSDRDQHTIEKSWMGDPDSAREFHHEVFTFAGKQLSKPVTNLEEPVSTYSAGPVLDTKLLGNRTTVDKLTKSVFPWRVFIARDGTIYDIGNRLHSGALDEAYTGSISTGDFVPGEGTTFDRRMRETGLVRSHYKPDFRGGTEGIGLDVYSPPTLAQRESMSALARPYIKNDALVIGDVTPGDYKTVRSAGSFNEFLRNIDDTWPESTIEEPDTSGFMRAQLEKMGFVSDVPRKNPEVAEAQQMALDFLDKAEGVSRKLTTIDNKKSFVSGPAGIKILAKLGDPIAKLKKEGYINFRGQDASTPEKVAQLMYPLRTTLIEKKGWLIVDGETGAVLSHKITTTNLPGKVLFTGKREETLNELVPWILSTAQKHGRKIKIVEWHNHNGGAPMPSDDDVEFSRSWTWILEEKTGLSDLYGGHVVSNDKYFGYIDKNFRKTVLPLNENSVEEGISILSKAELPHEVLKVKVFGNPELASVVKAISTPDGMVLIVGIRSTGEVGVVASVPEKLYNNPEQFGNAILGLIRKSGTSRVISYIDGKVAVDANATREHIRNGTLFTAVFNLEKGLVNPTVAIVPGMVHGRSGTDLAKISVRGLREPESEYKGLPPPPEELSTDLIKKPLEIREPFKVSDIGMALSNWTRERYGVVEPQGRTMNPVLSDKAVERWIQHGGHEVAYQIAQDNSMMGWYKKDVSDMFRLAKSVHPELSDPQQKKIFSALLALISPGNKVTDNFNHAMDAYDLWKNSGEIPTLNPNTKTGSWGASGTKTYYNNLKTLQELLDKNGGDINKTFRWLFTEHPVGELRATKYSTAEVEARTRPKGKADEMLLGAYIFGEKVGAFLANLNGLPSELTMDRWWYRTWNRVMGTQDLVPKKVKGTSEITYEIRDLPRNQNEQKTMRLAALELSKILKIDVNAMQAVAWYYEQALYKAHGADVEPFSYSDAARKYLAEKGTYEKTKTLQPPEEISAGNRPIEETGQPAIPGGLPERGLPDEGEILPKAGITPSRIGDTSDLPDWLREEESRYPVMGKRVVKSNKYSYLGSLCKLEDVNQGWIAPDGGFYQVLDWKQGHDFDFIDKHLDQESLKQESHLPVRIGVSSLISKDYKPSIYVEARGPITDGQKRSILEWTKYHEGMNLSWEVPTKDDEGFWDFKRGDRLTDFWRSIPEKNMSKDIETGLREGESEFPVTGGAGGTGQPPVSNVGLTPPPEQGPPQKGGIPPVVPRPKNFIEAMRWLFVPAGRGIEAKVASGAMRESFARRDLKTLQANAALREMGEFFRWRSKEDNLAFIDAIENDQPQNEPESDIGKLGKAAFRLRTLGEQGSRLGKSAEGISATDLQSVAHQMRAMLNQRVEQVRALGTGKLQTVIENYFPHIWKDPTKAEEFYKVYGGGGTLEGSKAFLKKRTIPTTEEGISAGLEPVSYNPVELVLLKLREIDKYIAAHQIMNDLEGMGLLHTVGFETKLPGYEDIDDKVARRYTKIGENKFALTSKIIAPEPVATLINNYLSPGLRGHERFADIFQKIRFMGNLLNMAQLGMSAFHLTFTSLDAANSNAATALMRLASGHPISATKAFAKLPLAPAIAFAQGRKIMDAALGRRTMDPETANIIEYALKGGAGFKMDSFYDTAVIGKFFNDLSRGTAKGYGMAAVRFPALLIETASRPIMDYLVPRMKLGVMADMINMEMERLGPDATPEEIRRRMMDVVDSVDNRMGQLRYDNLFWNKTLKDTLMVSVRSVGWNLGTFREFGGAAGDTFKAAKQIASGKAPELTHRQAYAIMTPILIALAGAVYQYLHTGETPEDMKDVYFPRTGRVMPNGDAERVSLPSYMKDLYSYSKHPLVTLSHKTHPLLNSVVDLIRNEDFYGNQIQDKEDPLWDQLKETGKYIASQFIPFSIRNLEQRRKASMPPSATGEHETDKGLLFTTESMFGAVPAPSLIYKTDAEAKTDELLGERMPEGARSRVEAERRKEMQDLLIKYRQEGRIGAKEMIGESDYLRPRDLRSIEKKAGKTHLAYGASKLGIDDVLVVYRAANKSEQDELKPVIMRKLRTLKQKSKAERESIIDKMNSLGLDSLIRRGSPEPLTPPFSLPPPPE